MTDDAKRNAIDTTLAAELVDHARRLAADPEARALVVTGEGRAFCAGADLPDVFGDERPTHEMRQALRDYYQCFLQIRGLTIPTFAAINGAAIGAGLNLALSCDVRITGPRASLGATFTKIGLHPGGGCSYFLTEAIGPERALRILLEGAVLDAATAPEQALVSQVAEDPLEAALAAAQACAKLEPWLAAAVKQSVALASTTAFEAVLEFESWAQAESTHNPRFREWINRFSATS